MDFMLTILGSGGAQPSPAIYPSAQILQIKNQYFLIDAGEGVQIQLLRYGFSHQKIDHIFISHLHGDHYLGLMGLLFSMHLARRQTDLHLYSPPGLDEIILLQLKHARSAFTYKIIFHPIHNGMAEILFEDPEIIVRCFPLHHRIQCSGFVFAEKTKPHRMIKEKLPEGILLQHIVLLKQGKDVYDGSGKLIYEAAAYTYPPLPSRSYAYCSDTAYHTQVASFIKNVNLCYHEATFKESEADKAKETYHSTATQAATIAKSAGVGKLVIGHISARYKIQDEVLQEAKGVFENTELAIEGQSFQVDLPQISGKPLHDKE
jgi:ribonuclease Z